MKLCDENCSIDIHSCVDIEQHRRSYRRRSVDVILSNLFSVESDTNSNDCGSHECHGSMHAAFRSMDQSITMILYIETETATVLHTLDTRSDQRFKDGRWRRRRRSNLVHSFRVQHLEYSYIFDNLLTASIESDDLIYYCRLVSFRSPCRWQ